MAHFLMAKAKPSAQTTVDLTEIEVLPAEQTVPVARKRAPRKPRAVGSSQTKVVVVKESSEQSDRPVELRKAPEAITIRNMSTSGEITFLQRKAYNVMLHIAQKNRQEDEITFEVSVTEFASLVGHTSANNREYLKEIARQLASIQAEFDFRGDASGQRKSSWGIANMVAEVYITEDGQKIRFSFPPELAKKLLDPEIYNRIDMRMQNVFTSYSALTLWETVSRYHGFAQRETFHEHWTTWSVLLSGSKTAHSQFRDFNKMLLRAVDQVNAHEQRFKIVLHLSKRGKKMDKMWFVLENSDQAQLPMEGLPAIVGEELLKRLRAFGLQDEEITATAMRFDEEYLLAQADYTDKRIKKKGAEPVASPKAFFMASVENNYADAPRRPPRTAEEPRAPSSPKLLPKAEPRMTLTTMKDAYKKAKVDEIRVRFAAQSPEKQREIIADVEDDLRKNSLAWQQYTKKGLTKLVEATIIELIYQKNVSEPSAEELLHFAFEIGAITAAAGAAS